MELLKKLLDLLLNIFKTLEKNEEKNAVIIEQQKKTNTALKSVERELKKSEVKKNDVFDDENW